MHQNESCEMAIQHRLMEPFLFFRMREFAFNVNYLERIIAGNKV